MNLRHTRTFVTVAELGTVSKAALRLRIAQPALSREISDLEQEIGVKLFDRVGRRLVLTGEGEQMLGDCRGLLNYASAIGERAQQLRHGDVGVLKVAATPHSEGVFSKFLHCYAQRYPNACQPTLTLGKHGGIEVARLAAYPLLLLDGGYGLRRAFDAACRLAGLKPNIRLQSRSPHTLLALAEAGHGVAVVASTSRTHRYDLKIVRLTYRGRPLREPLAVLWDKRRPLPRYATAFCQMWAAHVRDVLPITRPSEPKFKANKRPAARRA